MSDGIKAWYEDQDKYEALCKRYNEKMVANGQLLDNAEHRHFMQLSIRRQNEIKAQWENKKKARS